MRPLQRSREGRGDRGTGEQRNRGMFSSSLTLAPDLSPEELRKLLFCPAKIPCFWYRFKYFSERVGWNGEFTDVGIEPGAINMKDGA